MVRLAFHICNSMHSLLSCKEGLTNSLPWNTPIHMDIRKKVLFALLLLSLSLLNAAPVGTALSLAFRTPLFPSDPNIGQLVSRNAGPVENLTDQALRERWSPDWVERYVKKEARYGFAKTFDATLASLLPQTTFSLSKAKEREGAMSITVRIEQGGDEPVSYVTLSWEPDENGVYFIVAVSVAT